MKIIHLEGVSSLLGEAQKSIVSGLLIPQEEGRKTEFRQALRHIARANSEMKKVLSEAENG